MKVKYNVEVGRVRLEWTPVINAAKYKVLRRNRWNDTPEVVQEGVRLFYEQPVSEGLWYFDIEAYSNEDEKLESCSAYFPVRIPAPKVPVETGLAFPFRFVGGEVSKVSGIDLYVAQIYQVLLTNFGERPMRFFFGANLVEFLFESIDLRYFLDILLTRVNDPRFSVYGVLADMVEGRVRVKLQVSADSQSRIVGLSFGV